MWASSLILCILCSKQTVQDTFHRANSSSCLIGASKAGAECLSRAQTESIQAGMYNPSDSQEIELSAVQDNISFDSALSPQEL